MASAACAGSLSVSGVCGSSSAVAVDAGGIGVSVVVILVSSVGTVVGMLLVSLCLRCSMCTYLG